MLCLIIFNTPVVLRQYLNVKYALCSAHLNFATAKLDEFANKNCELNKVHSRSLTLLALLFWPDACLNLANVSLVEEHHAEA